MGVRVGIDTGGTFTDLVAVDGDGSWRVSKVPSDPADPVAAISAALRAADLRPQDIDFAVVGTTIGINAVLTRNGARVVYLTTKGFEDIPYIQRINRKYHYDFSWKKPTPLVRRKDCIGVRERLNEEGEPLLPLDLDDLIGQLEERLGADGQPPAVAICFLFSYLNPEHEIAARAALHARYPDLAISLSHEVAPIWREYERGTTVTVDAYLRPLVERYVDGVSAALATNGDDRPWALLKSNGGHALAVNARERAAHLLLSGIAGGAIGGAHFARAAGAEQAIAVDMGGTSCDVCLIVDGEPLYSSDFEIEFGFPVSVPSVSTRTIGAGGGSIGWVDPGGFLQVGPQSAGAVPGPACYAQGGEDATITDANVVLGRLDPNFFLGGQMRLDADRGRAAITSLAAQLNMSETATASAMLRIANENMANAIRIVTVEQGIDPRGLALVALGGAGPTHACEIADSIGMERVLVPPSPGLGSAFGALAATVRVDAVRSIYLTDSRATAAGLDEMFTNLEQQARADFGKQGTDSAPQMKRSIAMRYQGQNYEQEVIVPAGPIDDDALAAIYVDYGRLYEEFYGYRLDGIPVELVQLTVIATGAPAELEGELLTSARVDENAATRQVFFPEHNFIATPVLHRQSLDLDAEIKGPIVVDSMDSTIVVPPEWRLKRLASGILDLTRS